MRKTFEEWEKDRGLFAKDLGQFKSSKEMTQDEFLQLFYANSGSFVGVNYKDRVKFLEANGYEVSRENLIADLSAKPVEE